MQETIPKGQKSLLRNSLGRNFNFLRHLIGVRKLPRVSYCTWYRINLELTVINWLISKLKFSKWTSSCKKYISRQVRNCYVLFYFCTRCTSVMFILTCHQWSNIDSNVYILWNTWHGLNIQMYQYELAVHYRTLLTTYILWLGVVCWSIPVQVYSLKKGKEINITGCFRDFYFQNE